MNHQVLPLYVALVIIMVLSPTGAKCDELELHIGKFSAGDLAGWKEETIWNTRKSSYSFIKENGKSVLMGKSVNAGSGLLYKFSLDPKSYPVISWSWKIDHTVKKGNERTKEGHDFAVRLYVVFPRGLFSRTRAIEYVWGNVMAKGESLRSPYTKNAMMIAVNSGNELAGKWVTNKRNYVDDYRMVFGEEPPKVGAIAIMTDSDNTGETTVGYYGDIDFLAAAKEEELHNGEGKAKDLPKESQPKLQPQSLPDHLPAKELKPNDTVPKETSPRGQILKEQIFDGSSAPLGVPGVKPGAPGK